MLLQDATNYNDFFAVLKSHYTVLLRPDLYTKEETKEAIDDLINWSVKVLTESKHNNYSNNWYGAVQYFIKLSEELNLKNFDIINRFLSLLAELPNNQVGTTQSIINHKFLEVLSPEQTLKYAQMIVLNCPYYHYNKTKNGLCNLKNSRTHRNTSNATDVHMYAHPESNWKNPLSVLTYNTEQLNLAKSYKNNRTDLLWLRHFGSGLRKTINKWNRTSNKSGTTWSNILNTKSSVKHPTFYIWDERGLMNYLKQSPKSESNVAGLNYIHYNVYRLARVLQACNYYKSIKESDKIIFHNKQNKIYIKPVNDIYFDGNRDIPNINTNSSNLYNTLYTKLKETLKNFSGSLSLNPNIQYSFPCGPEKYIGNIPWYSYITLNETTTAEDITTDDSDFLITIDDVDYDDSISELEYKKLKLSGRRCFINLISRSDIFNKKSVNIKINNHDFELKIPIKKSECKSFSRIYYKNYKPYKVLKYHIGTVIGDRLYFGSFLNRYHFRYDGKDSNKFHISNSQTTDVYNAIKLKLQQFHIPLKTVFEDVGKLELISSSTTSSKSDLHEFIKNCSKDISEYLKLNLYNNTNSLWTYLETYASFCNPFG